MKKQNLIYLLLLTPAALWAQADESAPSAVEFDLSDVVVIDEAPTDTEPDVGTGTDAAAINEPAPAEEVVVVVDTPGANDDVAAGGATPPEADVAQNEMLDNDFWGVDGQSSTAPAGAADAGLANDAPEVVVEGADSVVIPDIDPEAMPDVVEIPEADVEGASFDAGGPEIPEAAAIDLDDSDVILELPGQGPTAAGTAQMAEEETISVDFPDEDVRTILRNVADLFDLNLVIPDTLQGRTSIKLRNVTWSQVFEVVLEPLGYTYVEDRNIIRVKSIEELTAEPVDTRVFVVNYATAGQLQGSIAPLIDTAAGGKMQVDVRSNALVITERPSRMNKIQEIIERLDKANDQVMIETKFIEVQNNDSKNIGVNWASLEGYDVSAGPFQRAWERERSSSDSTTREITEDTTAIWPAPETTDTANELTRTLTQLASTSRVDTAVFSASQFNLILSALKSNNDSKLVANPTVVTMNNQEATIDIVTLIPQVDFTFNAETGQREADGLAEPLEFGTKIRVTPQVNAAGFINLNVVPSVSNQIGVIETQIGPQPIIAERKSETNVVIKDGYTLAIGGLTQNEETNVGTKVPVLGNLPGVGRLFRSDSVENLQTNLIIFITAKTLNPSGSTYRDVVDPRVLNEMGIVPSRLPGYDIPQNQRERLHQLEELRAEADRLEALNELESSINVIEKAKERQAEELR